MGKVLRTHNNVYVFDDSRVSYDFIKSKETQLWHRILGHMNFDSMIILNKIAYVGGLPTLSRPNNSISKSYQFGKKIRTHFKIKGFSSSKPLKLIHTNICDPTRTKSPREERYFMLIDDFTKATWIILLK